MRAVGIKVLKNRLSEYVRMASQGETILVTDRDRVVAELVQPAYGRGASTGNALLDEAVRKGWLTPATMMDVPIPPTKPLMTLEELLEELDRDRKDR